MLSCETTVSEILLESSALAAVFDRLRIDYCDNGHESLRAVCGRRGLDPEKVMSELELALRRRQPSDLDVRTLSTHDLITKVIARHHRYLHRTLPWLEVLAARVVRVHAGRDPSLRDLARQVAALAQALRSHLDDEERNLFPALLADELELAGVLLDVMCAEHGEVIERLARLRETAADYAPPAWACASYRTLLAELAHLEADTLLHLHLEEHVLRPRFRDAS